MNTKKIIIMLMIANFLAIILANFTNINQTQTQTAKVYEDEALMLPNKNNTLQIIGNE